MLSISTSNLVVWGLGTLIQKESGPKFHRSWRRIAAMIGARIGSRIGARCQDRCQVPKDGARCLVPQDGARYLVPQDGARYHRTVRGTTGQCLAPGAVFMSSVLSGMNLD